MIGTPEEPRRARQRPRSDGESATPEQIDNWVEHSIKQAQRRGDFDNLPGAGKPLSPMDHPNDPDWWLRSLIQRERIDLVAALPGPMALRRERATYPEALADISDEERVRGILMDFNERVLADRRRPVATANSPVVAGRIDVEAMVERWRELRASLASASSPDRLSGERGSTEPPVDQVTHLGLRPAWAHLFKRIRGKRTPTE
ncbi:MAG: DUF1992 domain-containing protein [Ornithinimicrobium sp.]